MILTQWTAVLGNFKAIACQLIFSSEYSPQKFKMKQDKVGDTGPWTLRALQLLPPFVRLVIQSCFRVKSIIMHHML